MFSEERTPKFITIIQGKKSFVISMIVEKILYMIVLYSVEYSG